MLYAVEFAPRVKKDLRSIPKGAARRVLDAIESLRNDPRPEGCTKLAGHDFYRIRVGACRVIYTVRDDVVLVLVLKVGDRKDVYQRMDSLETYLTLRRQREEGTT